MLDRPPTTKHSHWQRAADVKGGQYFKTGGRWYLAITGSVLATGHLARMYTWMIRAYNPDGFDTWVGVYGPLVSDDVVMVEVSDEGKRPKAFTPATLRRKARAQREEAERQVALARRKEVLAGRLETGAIPG